MRRKTQSNCPGQPPLRSAAERPAWATPVYAYCRTAAAMRGTNELPKGLAPSTATTAR